MCLGGPASSIDLDLQNRVDEIADRFEGEWKAGRQPRIEDYVDARESAIQLVLLRELIELDAHFRRRLGEVPRWKEYLERFPQAAELLAGEDGSPDRDRAAGSADAPIRGTIGAFELLEFVGEGSFGAVWKARDTRIGRPVAVKIPRTARLHDSATERTLHEAQAAGQLQHPHIVAVFEIAREGSTSFLVTEFIDGSNLKERLNRRQPSFEESARLCMVLARALQYAHTRNVIHRDLKPANVLLDGDGQPHLADFGLARRLLDDDSPPVDGQLIGTPLYMSPEQARGDQGVVDHRTDVYALGVILYELLTGQPPFRGDLESLLRQIAEAKPKPPRQMNPAVPEELENLCLKCLSKDPASRCQTAGELADDLERFLNGESLRGVPSPLPRRVTKWMKRRRRFVTSLAATAALCLGGAGGLWWWNQPPSPRRLVEFATDPPGCEITVVKLDPVTGDPDPTQIEHAPGKTPLKMRLVPGDYLVVAVLDENRFHEVHRHVPEINEGTPLAHNSRYWKLHADGCIRFLSRIKIPSSQRGDLVYVNGSNNWMPKSGFAGDSGTMVVPPLFVDRHEHTATSEVAGFDSRLKQNHYIAAEAYAESVGKRLPSQLELLYAIQQQFERSLLNHEMNEIDTATSIRGLSSVPWEWTTTKAGASSAMVAGTMRILRGGAPQILGEGGNGIRYPIKLARETFPDREFGVRCVRSVRPRLTTDDFIRQKREDR